MTPPPRIDHVSNERLLDLIGNTGSVASAFFSPGGRCVATSGFDDNVRIWDLADGQESCFIATDRPAAGTP